MSRIHILCFVLYSFVTFNENRQLLITDLYLKLKQFSHFSLLICCLNLSNSSSFYDLHHQYSAEQLKVNVHKKLISIFNTHFNSSQYHIEIN